jgi:hypothetical protein
MIERLEAAKKCDRISGGAVRSLRIRLSQLKLQWRSCILNRVGSILVVIVIFWLHVIVIDYKGPSNKFIFRATYGNSIVIFPA